MPEWHKLTDELHQLWEGRKRLAEVRHEAGRWYVTVPGVHISQRGARTINEGKKAAEALVELAKQEKRRA